MAVFTVAASTMAIQHSLWVFARVCETREENHIVILVSFRNTYIHTHILAPINLGIHQIPTHLRKTKPVYNEINTLDNIWKLAHLKKALKRGMELCLCRHRKCTVVSCIEHRRIGCVTSPVLSEVVASEMNMQGTTHLW
jgi:hypothetical protein